MTTERDEYGVWHIDGPPYRGFLIAEHPNGSGAKVEVIYKLFAFIGSEREVHEACDNLMQLVRAELNDLWDLQKDPLLHKIIWWRRRPQFDYDGDGDRWRFSARFATTPGISDDFWSRWAIQEGDYAKNAKDLT